MDEVIVQGTGVLLIGCLVVVAAVACLLAPSTAYAADSASPSTAETPAAKDGGKMDAVPTVEATEAAPQEGAVPAAEGKKGGVTKNFSVRKNGNGDEVENAEGSKVPGGKEDGAEKEPAARKASKTAPTATRSPDENEPAFHPLALTDRDGFLEVAYKNELEKRDRQFGGTSWHSTENQFRETARLNLHGYMYHPRFVRFDVGGEFSGIEDSYTGLGVEEREHRPLSGDYRFAFLEDHPYTLTLSGFSRQTEVDSIYAPSFLLNSDNNAAAFRLRSGPLPFELSYSHQHNFGTGNGVDINDTTDSLSFDSNYEIGGQSHGEIYYYQDTVDQGTFNTKISTRQLRLENTTYFDSDQHIELISHAGYNEYSGNATAREMDVREVLQWRHTSRLRTTYEAGWNRNDVQGQVSDAFNGRATITYRLFDSLLSTGEVYGQHFEGSIGSSSVAGASITETYEKKLNDSMDLVLSLHGFAENRDTSPKSGIAWVVNESHGMRRSQPSQLSHLDVVRESITVRSSTGARQYFIYTDYVVIQQGHITQILPTVTGHIEEGEAVNVTYYYELPGAYTVTATGQESAASLQFWKALTVYSRFLSTNYGLSGNNPLVIQPDPLDRLVIGSSLVWKRFRAIVEYEHVASKLQPETSLSESGSAEWNPWREIQTTLTLSHASKSFSTTNGGSVESYGANGSVSSRIGRRGILSLEADYSREQWDPMHAIFDRELYYVKTGYEWRYRGLSAKVSARFTEADSHGEKEHQHRIDVVLRRDF